MQSIDLIALHKSACWRTTSNFRSSLWIPGIYAFSYLVRLETKLLSYLLIFNTLAPLIYGLSTNVGNSIIQSRCLSGRVLWPTSVPLWKLSQFNPPPRSSIIFRFTYKPSRQPRLDARWRMQSPWQGFFGG